MRLHDELASWIVVPIVAVAVAVGAMLGFVVKAGGGEQPLRADPASRVAIGDLSEARTTARRDLARATTRGAQRAAAEGLRRALLQAAGQLAAGHGALAGALRGAAGAYAELGRAAGSGDEAAYARATRSVAVAERRLEGALRAMRS